MNIQCWNHYWPDLYLGWIESIKYDSFEARPFLSDNVLKLQYRQTNQSVCKKHVHVLSLLLWGEWNGFAAKKDTSYINLIRDTRNYICVHKVIQYHHAENKMCVQQKAFTSNGNVTHGNVVMLFKYTRQTYKYFCNIFFFFLHIHNSFSA